jgi:hypothetical protein
MLVFIFALFTYLPANGQASKSPALGGTRAESKVELSHNRYLKILKYSDFSPMVARISRSLACDGEDILVSGGCKASVPVIFQNGPELIDTKNELPGQKQVAWTCDVSQLRIHKAVETPLELEITVICAKQDAR